MKRTKKLESLKQIAFTQDFNKVLGGGFASTNTNHTGELRYIYNKDGQVVKTYYAPETPKGMGIGS